MSKNTREVGKNRGLNIGHLEKLHASLPWSITAGRFGRLYGSTQGVSGESELFYKNIKRLNQIENEYKGRMKAGEDAESFRKQESLVDHIGLGNQADAAVSKLRRQRREEQLRADPGWQERVMGIDQQIEGVMRGVNRVVGK